jgi:hypothetical protein
MSSAKYTNRIRTLSEAKVTKVQYPGRQALSYVPIQSTAGCSPNYNPIKYTIPCCSNN